MMQGEARLLGARSRQIVEQSAGCFGFESGETWRILDLRAPVRNVCPIPCMFRGKFF